MKYLNKKTIFSTIFTTLLLVSPAVISAEELPMVEGKVTQIMKDTGKVTINHGPIKNLDMGAMTMIFKAKDAKLLKGIKTGDKVMFTVIDENGKLVITTMKKGK